MKNFTGCKMRDLASPAPCESRFVDTSNGLASFNPVKTKSLFLCAVLGGAAFLPITSTTQGKEAPSANRIILVGDSTVAPKSGWGDAFGDLVGAGAICENLALGGRSSKSYRDEGHWQKVLEAKPAWVLIQFGHNDQPGKGPKRETDPKTTFRENLKRYVAEVRAIGGKPVLVTSLTRRNFNAQGKIEPGVVETSKEDNAGAKDEKKSAAKAEGKAGDKVPVSHPDLLNNYAEAARIVAAEEKVPLIDLNARSIEQMNQLGPEAAVAFDAVSKDPSHLDKTHLSEKGARETAKLVADEIRKNVPELAKLLKAVMAVRLRQGTA
jgi:pectinesterase